MAPWQLIRLVLYSITGRLREVRLEPGERVQPDKRHLFIVTRGTGQLVREGPGGHDILLRVVRPGAVVAEDVTLEAETPLVLLAMPGRVNKRDRAVC
jgi:CRP-like cAMP-binding protein